MKRPSFQFYPGDWLVDPALRLVSVAARGAWIDMLCVMHQSDDYGHLKVNHKVILPINLARMLGATLAETEGWLEELESAGVFSRDDEACVFSRRMLRDEELRQVRAAGGKLGGNPALKGNRERLGGRLTLEVKQNPTPSSSSSSPSSSSKKQEQEPRTQDPVALARMAMIEGGIRRDQVFGFSASIKDLLDHGVTPEELGAVSRQLCEQKGAPTHPNHVITTIRNRMEDAARAKPISKGGNLSLATGRPSKALAGQIDLENLKRGLENEGVDNEQPAEVRRIATSVDPGG